LGRICSSWICTFEHAVLVGGTSERDDSYLAFRRGPLFVYGALVLAVDIHDFSDAAIAYVMMFDLHLQLWWERSAAGPRIELFDPFWPLNSRVD
jgi:hypothetical protein